MGFRLAGEGLCWCPCHDDCRYTGTVNVTPHEWWDSCRCPGSERMRENGPRWWGRDRPPTLEEALWASRADDRAWSEAEAAVEARAAGRSQAEIRQFLIEELQSRNRPVPDDKILDLHVDKIMHALALPSPLAPDSSAFTALKALVRLVWVGYAEHKKFAAAMSGSVYPMEGPRGQPPYLVEKDYSLPMTDVVLDPATTAILGQLGEGGLVSLERDPKGSVAVYWIRQPRYQPALDAAQRSGCALMVWSKLSGHRDGAPRLQVYPAGIL
jgi:hypothetical protein